MNIFSYTVDGTQSIITGRQAVINEHKGWSVVCLTDPIFKNTITLVYFFITGEE